MSDLEYLFTATIDGAFRSSPIAPFTWIFFALAIITRIAAGKRPRVRELLLATPILFCPVIVMFGALFALHDTRSGALWREALCPVILLAQIYTSSIIVWRAMEGIRVSATFFLLSILCVSLIAAFESTMSITNRWV